VRGPARAIVLAAWIVGAASTAARAPDWTERPPPALPAAGVTDHSQATRLRFVVFGDGGTGTARQRRIGKAMAATCRERGGCDFALVAGDLIYGHRNLESAFEEKFERAYEPLGRLDFWVVAGNHDWKVRGLVEAELRYSDHSPRWRMPSHDYAVPLLPEWLRIYGLDTTKLEYEYDDGQLERAREELCEGSGWRLLLGHHPVYSSGYHANSSGELPGIKTLLEPLIEACGVQLYLSGHDHHQEHITAPGFDQIVQGAAAQLRRVYRPRNRDREVQQLAAASSLGFALIEVTGEQLTLLFFRENDGGVQAFHCRVFELAEFEDPQARSRSCDGSPNPDGSRR